MMQNNYYETLKQIQGLNEKASKHANKIAECMRYKDDNSYIPNIAGTNRVGPKGMKTLVEKTIYKEQEKLTEIYEKINELNKSVIEPVTENRAKLGGCRVHAIMNNKGGTGKSTITTSLAYTLSENGYKVLLIDTDSQASATQLLNIFDEDSEGNNLNTLDDLYEKMLNDIGNFDWEDIKNVIDDPNNKPRYYDYAREKRYLNFDLIPAGISMLINEVRLSRHNDGIYYLHTLIELIKKNRDYDFILIDCPPSLGTLSLNSLMAAESVIVPISLSVMVLRSTRNLIKTVSDIQALAMKQRNIKHKGILGMVKNEYTKNRRINISLNQIVDELFPIPCFDTAIPVRAACAQMEYSRMLFAQDKSIIREGFWQRLAQEIVDEDIRNRDLEPKIIDKVKWDGR